MTTPLDDLKRQTQRRQEPVGREERGSLLDKFRFDEPEFFGISGIQGQVTTEGLEILDRQGRLFLPSGQPVVPLTREFIQRRGFEKPVTEFLGGVGTEIAQAGEFFGNQLNPLTLPERFTQEGGARALDEQQAIRRGEPPKTRAESIGRITGSAITQGFSEPFERTDFPALEAAFLFPTLIAGPLSGIRGIKLLPKPSALSPFVNRQGLELAGAGAGGMFGPLPVGNKVGKFATEFQPLPDLIDEVDTLDNVVVQNLVGAFVNPSVAKNSPIGKIVTSFRRQQIAADEMTNTIIAGALDSHLNRFSGKLPFKLDKEGFFEDTGKLWQDVFSNPGGFTLTPGARAYIDDFLQVVDEMEGLRQGAGLVPLNTRSVEGWFYVPRFLDKLRGIPVTKPANERLERVFEEATEGAQAGVEYSTSPRETLALHTRRAYREMAEAQINEEISKLARTQKEIVAERLDPNIVALRNAALENFREVSQIAANERRLVRNARIINNVRLSQATRQFLNLQRRLAVARTKLRIQGPGLNNQRQIAVDELLERTKQQQAFVETLTQSIKNIPRITNVSGRLPAVSPQTRLLQQQAKAQVSAAQTKYRSAIKRASKTQQIRGDLFGRAEDEIPIKLWRGKYLPTEEAAILEKEFNTFGFGSADVPGGITKAVGRGGNVIRFLSAALDFGAPFIQGLPVIATNPAAWAKAAAHHYAAWADPTVQARYIRENIDTFNEMTKYGIPIGDTEFFRALRPGEGIPISQIIETVTRSEKAGSLFRAGGRQSFGRFQSSYNMFLTMARAEMYKGLKPVWTDGLDELAAYIRNLTGGLESKALGVSPSRAAWESTWMAFSPRLLRSTIALTADAFRGARPGSTQRQRRSLLTMITFLSGVHAFFYTTQIAKNAIENGGVSWDDLISEEAVDSVNPLKGRKYLAHTFNDDTVGVGGQIRALTQLALKMGSALAPGGRPIEDLISTNLIENPILSFMASRGAPGLNIAGAVVEGTSAALGNQIDVLPYDDIDSLPEVAMHIGESALPFTIQGRLEGENLSTVGFALVGARTQAETPFEARDRLQELERERLLEEGQLQSKDTSEFGTLDAVDKDLIRQAPEVSAAVQKARDLQGERENAVELWRREREAKNKEHDDRISSIAERLGPSKKFREQFSVIERDRSRDLAAINADPDNKEAQEFFEEVDPSEAEFDVARQAYFDITNNPIFRDDEIDYYDVQAVNEALAEEFGEGKQYSDETLDQIIEFNRRNDNDLVKELRSDRQSLADYLNLARRVSRIMGASEVFAQYMAAGPQERRDLRLSNPRLRLALIATNKIKAEMRKSFPSTAEQLLFKWEYITCYMNPDNVKLFPGQACDV